MKQLVCGDGGMLYCKDKKDARRFDKLTYLGLESKSGFSNSVDKKWWEFDISSPSRRSITNDIQAAIGIVQLKKMDEQISIRSKIHNTYNKELGNLEWLDVPEKIPSHINSSYYMYHIQTKHRDELAKYLRDNGVYTTFRYYPLHWVEYYKLGIKLPNTDYAANNTLCIPLHQSLTDNDIDKIITLIKSFKK
jgi:aminotransferase